MNTSVTVGDRVSWNSSQGEVRGRVIQRKSSDFIFDNQKFTASAEDPSFIVESDKTGSRAAHRGEALHRITRRRH
jgi:hypothetical protein